jgi:hypothetical protein
MFVANWNHDLGNDLKLAQRGEHDPRSLEQVQVRARKDSRWYLTLLQQELVAHHMVKALKDLREVATKAAIAWRS